MISLNYEGCQNNVTLFSSSVFLDQKSAFFQTAIKYNLFALPVISFMIVKVLQNYNNKRMYSYFAFNRLQPFK